MGVFRDVDKRMRRRALGPPRRGSRWDKEGWNGRRSFFEWVGEQIL